MYADFASWLQSRLLRIYASPAHSAHHEKTTHVHTVILSVIKDQDKDAFIYLISKLIKLLSGKCIHMYIGLQCALYSMKVLRQSRNTAVNANCLFLSQNLKKNIDHISLNSWTMLCNFCSLFCCFSCSV